ncbi:MAG: GtrA family protein [Acutalibacter sp.]|nr:GtrA family protein [Acutalibacter sp.]
MKYKELILYVLFGGLTTLVNWGLYTLLVDVFHVPYLWSTAISQIIAILFAYVTNRIWVFESKVRSIRGIALEMAKFFGARAASFVLDLGCMYVGVELFHIDDKWMKLIANIIVIIVNYVLSKLFVFSGHSGKEAGKKSGNNTSD